MFPECFELVCDVGETLAWWATGTGLGAAGVAAEAVDGCAWAVASWCFGRWLSGAYW